MTKQYLVLFTQGKGEKYNPYSMVNKRTLNSLLKEKHPTGKTPEQMLVKSHIELEDKLYSKEEIEKLIKKL